MKKIINLDFTLIRVLYFYKGNINFMIWLKEYNIKIHIKKRKKKLSRMLDYLIYIKMKMFIVFIFNKKKVLL